MPAKNTFRENAVRVIAVLGLIAILLLGAWGIIQLAFFLPSLFSGFGDGVRNVFTREPAAEELRISLPPSVVSGSPLVINWDHNNGEGAYSYSVSYACQEGVVMNAPLPNGETEETPCNTPLNFTNATSAIRLIPELATGTRQASTTLTVAATKLETGAITVTDSAPTLVKAPVAATPEPERPATSGSATTPSSQYVPSGRTQNLYGYADLAVRITSNPGSVYPGARVSLQFVVENIGTNVSGANWSFNALLPYNPVYTYPSGPQQALYPGDKIVYTLGYNAPYNQAGSDCGYTYSSYGNSYPCGSYPGGCVGYSDDCYGSGSAGYYYGGTAVSTATITVDPYNQVPESNEINNTASVSYTNY